MKFENKDNRLEYLNKKLDDLLSGMNKTYGQDLLDELIVRLQRTIVDFNEEVEKIMGSLKDNSERKSKIIHDLMEGNQITSNQKNIDNENNDEADGENEEIEKPEMSEWEKRLEGLK